MTGFPAIAASKGILLNGSGYSDVKVIMNGEMKVQSVEITAETIEDKDQLESDIKNAMDSATEKAQKVAANMMKEITGGNLPF